MLLGVPGLNKILMRIVALLAACAITVSCGSYKSPTVNGHKVSGLKFRAFVSNPLLPVGGGANAPVVNIVDALRDKMSTSLISLSGSAQPGLMVLSPDMIFTLIFSPSGNSVVVVDNTTESIASAAGTNVPLSTISLPGFTESIVVNNFHSTAFAAVPTTPVAGQSPGTVEVLNLLNGSISASIPVPGAHFLVASPDGNRILVFSDNSDTVTMISPILVGTHTDPRSYVAGFDRPVWGVFNSSGTAYILNCGLPCGGKAAGVSVLDVGSSTPLSTTPVSAATYGLLSGTTLYVAGTPSPSPPGTNTCAGTRTAATTCGKLTLLDVGFMTVKSSATITDGYHDRMQISEDGQLFIGSHGCRSFNIPGGEVRGCLSIFNSGTSTVVIPPQQGDVTGIQPITGRNVVYVCQNGGLSIYDTKTDKLQVTTGNNQSGNGQVDIVGDAVDVKLVD